MRQDTPLGVFQQNWTNLYATLRSWTRIINWLTVRDFNSFLFPRDRQEKERHTKIGLRINGLLGLRKWA